MGTQFETSLDHRTLLEHYAELLVVHGMNVQEGQSVFLAGEVAHRELLLLVAEQAYDKRAEYVGIELLDDRFLRVRLDRTAEEKWLEALPKYYQHKFTDMVTDQTASLRLVGPEFPEALLGSDPQRANTVRKASYMAKKHFYDHGIDKNQVHWTVAAAATTQWAKRVYAEKTEEEALDLLWRDLFSFCRVGRGDHLEVWKTHDATLHRRAAWLNDQHIAELHFHGPGTDLVVGMSPQSRFHGGTSESGRGVRFEPNLPTEECFTTPDWRTCNGTASATRPFYVNGVLITDLCITLKDGKIVEFSASSGRETFDAYISSDDGARRLGEVALVDCSSPIFQSGRVYEEILLDENAACHIAVGSGYRFCLDLPANAEEAEFVNVGCNSSSVHTDIMISDQQTSVIGRKTDSSEVAIISDGMWSAEAK